jgi:hypothetical protein
MDTLFEPSLEELALKDLENLFNDKDFHLIYVDDDYNMSLVTPFGDESVKERIKEYRCISHVWLTGDGKDHVWKDQDWEDDKGVKHKGHKVVGVTWKVEVREEKRERVMEVFKHHKGYFWMDVLCTNQDTSDKPLDVMGDIYRKCKECVCLLDYVCDVPGYISEKELWIDVAKDVREYVESDRECLGDKYDNIDKSAYEDSSNTSFGVKYCRYLESVKNAQWFNRVWTWQEAALPPKLLFCSEQSGEYRYDPYGPEFLRDLFPYKCLDRDLLNRLCKNLDNEDSSDDYSDDSDVDKTDKSRKLLEYYAITDHLKRMKFFSTKYSIWDNVRTMAVSTKECTEEKDFVYGVTGILGITIQKGQTLTKAAVELEKGLQKYGIFNVESSCRYHEGPRDLQELYFLHRFVDGINVLGEVDITTFGENVRIYEYKEYKISEESWFGIGWQTCTYGTEIWEAMFVRDRYKVGDILKVTKIGRENCTFESYGRTRIGSNTVVEIIDGKVEIIGEIRPKESYSTYKFDDSNDDGHEE